MRRHLNTLYVTRYQTNIRSRRGSLVVSDTEGSHRVPLEEVDSVVLFAGQITTDAIASCVRRHIRVASLTRSGRVRFIVGGPTAGNVHLRIAQYKTSIDKDRSLELCRVIVAAKLRSASHVLFRWSRDNSDISIANDLARRSKQIRANIDRLVDAPTPDHVRGIEGDAARLHFGGIARILHAKPMVFEGRTRRPPRDPVNATLSFCYSLVATEGVGACDTVGLDPQIGFLHTPRSGRPSLALDLAEEFRPLVDRFVVGIIRRRQLNVKDFTTTPGGAVYLTDEGRKKLLRYWEEHKNTDHDHPILKRPVGRWALPTVQSTLMARYLRGDLPAYPPFVLQG